VRAVTLSAGRLEVEVLPAAGLDLGAATLDGERFSWQSDGAPWWGGLMFTCGLHNVGVPSEGHPQHGAYRTLPAEDVEIRGAAARGRVVDASLELIREVIVTADGVRVTDVVRNTDSTTEPAPVLYHVNVLWDTVATDAAHVEPRDDDARAVDWRSQGPPGPERVYEHVDATHATVTFGPIRIEVRSNLQRLWQWIDPTLGVLGIEPANCSVLGRARDRAEGRLPLLAPGEVRTTTLAIEVHA
jgi:Domain of unknown function (DUF4432)